MKRHVYYYEAPYTTYLLKTAPRFYIGAMGHFPSMYYLPSTYSMMVHHSNSNPIKFITDPQGILAIITPPDSV